MATGALDANGIWLYGEDDSEPTASALLNKLGNSVSDKFDGGLPVANGGTGSTTVAGAQDSLRVGLVPISPSSVTYVGGTGSTGTLGLMTFSNCTKLEINGVFSGAYENYRIMLRAAGSANGLGLRVRMRQSGTDNSSPQYYTNGVYQNGNTAVGAYFAIANSEFTVGDVGTNNGHMSSDIFSPYLNSVQTSINFINKSLSSAPVHAYFSGSGRIDATNQYGGISIFLTTGTFTGTVQILGYNV